MKCDNATSDVFLLEGGKKVIIVTIISFMSLSDPVCWCWVVRVTPLMSLALYMQLVSRAVSVVSLLLLLFVTNIINPEVSV